MRRIVVLAAMTASLAAFAGTAMAATIDVNPWSYDPKPVSIKRNDTVKWSWNDPAVGHNVYIVKSSGAAVRNSGSAKKKSTFSYRFTAKGTYTVYCRPHREFMQTTVTVN